MKHARHRRDRRPGPPRAALPMLLLGAGAVAVVSLSSVPGPGDPAAAIAGRLTGYR